MADDEGVVAIPISFLQFLAVRCPYPCKPGDPGTEIPPKCNGVMYFLPERNHKNEQQDFVKLSGFMHNWCMCVCVWCITLTKGVWMEMQVLRPRDYLDSSFDDH